MAKLTLYAALTAGTDDRTLTATLLPYGEVGITNLGKLRAARGRLTFAPGVLPVNLDHDPEQVVGRIANATDTDTALRATYALDPGVGDAVLADARLAAQLAARGMPTGDLRAATSIEVDDCVVRGGELVGGVVTGAAILKDPAFAGARLAAAELDDVPDMGNDDEADPAPDPAPAGEVVAESSVDETYTYVSPVDGVTTTTTYHTESTTTETEPKGTQTMTAARVLTPAHAGPTTPPAIGKQQLFAALAGFHNTPGARLEAALAGITPADLLGIEQPQYVGQLWDGTAYDRIIVPAFNHADLTSMKVEGWRFKDGKRPEVAKFTGYPAEVHSNDVETEPVDLEAYRVAGGWQIDRKYRDFPSEAFWAAFFAAVTESTKIKSDLYALEDILTGATEVDLDTATLEAGVDVGLAAVVRGIVSVIKGTRSMPDGAFVDVDMWEGTMLTRQENVLPMLDAMLGFQEGTLAARRFQLTPCADLEAGDVLVKARAAATVHELPGAAPIRVEAIDAAKGSIDEAVFAYQAVNIHNAKGLVLVHTVAAGA